MREQTAEVVARWAEALRGGDLAEELWDEGCEIVNAKVAGMEGTYRGRDGLRRWWDDFAEAVSDLALEIEEITPLDEERVLTVNRWAGRFKFTGLPFDGSWASVITVRGGRIVHAIGYLTKGRALKSIEVGRSKA